MTQPSLLDAAQHAGPYQPDSETSFAAAVAAGPRISPQKQQILASMKAASGALLWSDGVLAMPPSWGWTQDEMAYWLDRPRSTVCARFNELEHDGWIKKTDDTRPSRYGRECAVYVLASNASTPARRDTP
jgi:hypothetical protein